MSRMMPEPEQVATAAVKLLRDLGNDLEFGDLKRATVESGCSSLSRFLVVDRWKMADDKAPLFTEAWRSMALRAAVFEITGHEDLAQLPVAVPVDEMVHAVLLQSQLLGRIAERAELRVIHQTDREGDGYRVGDYTHQAYSLAWGEPPQRYWVPADEVERRTKVLARRGMHTGVQRLLSEHPISFAAY